MTKSLGWPSPSEIQEMPVDELAIRVLTEFIDITEGKPWSRQAFISQKVMDASRLNNPPGALTVTSSLEALHSQPNLARAMAEAWDWLGAEGMVAEDPVTINQAGAPGNVPYFTTRWGHLVAARGADGLSLSRARRRLGLELHPILAPLLERLVQVGAFEQAAFVALREIEQRVRSLADSPKDKQRRNDLRGESLMNFAFSPESGPLADTSAEVNERQGIMNLFKGAFAAFRNPLGHRTIEFDDPTEAAEVVLLADLLMRQLDHIESRMA